MNLKSLILSSFALVIAFSPLFTGCGKDNVVKGDDKLTAKLNGLEYVGLDKAALVTTAADKVSGTGSLVFLNPRPLEDSNYELTFQLEPQGSVSVVTNTDNKLAGGVSVVFSRTAANKVKIEILSAGKPQDVTADFPAIDATKPVSFTFDVHAHGHAIFQGFGEDKEYAFPKVAAKFWGLKLNKATVTKAAADKAKSAG